MNPNEYLATQLRAIRAEAMSTAAKVDALLATLGQGAPQPENKQQRPRFMGDQPAAGEGE